MKKIKLKHVKRTEKLLDFWKKIAREYYFEKVSVVDISQKYLNPRTHKPIGRTSVYYIFRELEKMYGNKVLEEIKK